MAMPAILYINGLGTGETQWYERRIFRHLEQHGYQTIHGHINWRSEKSFQELFDRATELAEKTLQRSSKLVIVGVSAGGSLAINVFGRLSNQNVVAINLCGRLQNGKLPWWDYRKLNRMAHLDTPLASQSFYDSVQYCETHTIPSIGQYDKQKLYIVKQLADFVVPRKTMLIESVQTKTISVVGHGAGILVGCLQLPAIIKSLEK